jgi:hypothetical protein
VVSRLSPSIPEIIEKAPFIGAFSLARRCHIGLPEIDEPNAALPREMDWSVQVNAFT